MTIKELREAIARYPDNMDVFIAERKTEFAYGLLNSVSSKVLDMYEDESCDGEPLAQIDCVILDEE